MFCPIEASSAGLFQDLDSLVSLDSDAFTTAHSCVLTKVLVGRHIRLTFLLVEKKHAFASLA